MKIVVVSENQEFNPGVILAPGSVTFPKELPLFYGNQYERGPIGKVVNVRREGNDIVGDVMDFEISATLKGLKQTPKEDVVRAITNGELMGVSVVPFPACHPRSTNG